jgi:hypothetical protein
MVDEYIGVRVVSPQCHLLLKFEPLFHPKSVEMSVVVESDFFIGLFIGIEQVDVLTSV